MADQPASTASEVPSAPPPATTEEQKKTTEALSDAPAKSDVAQPSSSVAQGTSNGDNDPKPSTNGPSTETPSEAKDMDMKDASEVGASATEVATTAPETVEESAVDSTAAPSTPATAAKKTNGNTSSKKKSTGVPEHKSKKLNKKKSKVELKLNLYCKPGEMYLARMKGHAPWPSIICDEEILPASLLNSRPVTTALADGTFKRPDYAPGGKRESERTFPVMFLYTNEFAWLPNVDLTSITPEECKDIDQKGKSKSLIAAYGVAAEGHDLQHYKTMLSDHQAAVQEDLERQAEREAEKAAAKAAKAENKKTKRKSTAKADENDRDEMDVDEDGETEKPKSKKRKKDTDAEDDAEAKPTKTPKLKLNGPKTPSTEKKAPAKPKSSSKKAAPKKDSDEEMEDAPAEAALSPAEVKEKKEKEIRYYRHKLQKGLLSRDDTPGDEDVATASGYLTKLETYPGLEGDIIRSTKIHKVLRAIIRLPNIPKDEEYLLKKRSGELLTKWNSILGSDGGADGADGPAASAPAPEETKADEPESKPTATEPEPKTNGTAEPAAPATEKPSEPAVEESTKPVAKEPEKDEPAKTNETTTDSTSVPAQVTA